MWLCGDGTVAITCLSCTARAPGKLLLLIMDLLVSLYHRIEHTPHKGRKKQNIPKCMFSCLLLNGLITACQDCADLTLLAAVPLPLVDHQHHTVTAGREGLIVKSGSVDAVDDENDREDDDDDGDMVMVRQWGEQYERPQATAMQNSELGKDHISSHSAVVLVRLFPVMSCHVTSDPVCFRPAITAIDAKVPRLMLLFWLVAYPAFCKRPRGPSDGAIMPRCSCHD